VFLDTTVPEIKFDKEGICNFCKLHFEFQKFYPISKKKLFELKKQILNVKKIINMIVFVVLVEVGTVLIICI
jgi:hypothetical protein